MKRKICFVLGLTILSALIPQLTTLFAQGTAFTYQGRLNDANGPANGSYDLMFTLFNTNSTGTALAGPLTNSATLVSNGLFTTTIDFGPGVFAGGSNWLEIAVSISSANSFTTLAPRQQVTPTPYAITAERLANPLDSNSLPANVVTNNAAGLTLSGAFAGDGSGLSSVNAYSVNGLTTDSLWKLGGNAGANPTNGAFLGTTDTLPLEFKVNGSRALRLEYAYDSTFGGAVPNVIGGYAGNVVSSGLYGALIAGGGNATYPNRVGGKYASVLGGYGNTASGYVSTSMGVYTTASGNDSTAMGIYTAASGDGSTAMGSGSTASGFVSTAMGNGSAASGYVSTAMGYFSIANAYYSLAAGYYATANNIGSFVWADASGDSRGFSDSKANQFLIRASGGVGIGTSSTPPGGLNVASGGLAVTGASSPNYPGGAKGVFIENGGTYGAVYAFDYATTHTLPLCLNSPGGNVGVGTANPTHLFQVGNAYCDGNTWAPSSDRNVKAGIQPVDAQMVLAKVAALPITSWHYTNDVATPHIGPMAQDFYAAFNVGPDDKHITTTDESGVALAAIQGLNEKLEARSEKLEAENAELKQSVAELKQLVQTLAAKK